MIDEADLWYCGGSPENWMKSIKYSLEIEPRFTYWGIHHEDLNNILKYLEDASGRELVGRYRQLIENLVMVFNKVLTIKKPNIAMFYYTSPVKGYIGAGLILSLELNPGELFWKDEYNQMRVMYPYRFRMLVLWLHETVLQSPNNVSA